MGLEYSINFSLLSYLFLKVKPLIDILKLKNVRKGIIKDQF
jgi:hypothetical protein